MIRARIVIALVRALYSCAGPQDVSRLDTIGEAIASVSHTEEDAAALLAIGRWESGFCADVHSGARKGGLGEGLWQLEPGSRRTRPFSGLDRASTEHAAEQALYLWKHTRCADLDAHFGAYAGLGCRAWNGSARRTATYYWALAQLRATVRHGHSPKRYASAPWARRYVPA